MVERRFFHWNNQFNPIDINLGDNILNLIQQKLVRLEVNSKTQETNYTYFADERIKISLQNGKVNSIFFSQSSGDSLIGINTNKMRKTYGSYDTNDITQQISLKYSTPLEINTLNEFRENYSGDFLIVVFRSMIPFSLFLKRV